MLGAADLVGADEPEATVDAAPAEPEVEPAPAVAARHCEWFVNTTGETFRKCGEPIMDGLELCPRHRELRAHTLLSGPRLVVPNEFFPPDEPAAPRPAPPTMDWGAVIDA